MPLARRQRFINGQFAWMMATALGLVLVNSLTYELFFNCSLIGFLILVKLTAPIHITPWWRRRLTWIVALGLLAFGYLVARRILEILPAGVV